MVHRILSASLLSFFLFLHFFFWGDNSFSTTLTIRNSRIEYLAREAIARRLERKGEDGIAVRLVTCRWQDIVHKYKDCLLRAQFNSLPNYIHELTDTQVSWDKVPVILLLLVNIQRYHQFKVYCQQCVHSHSEEGLCLQKQNDTSLRKSSLKRESQTSKDINWCLLFLINVGNITSLSLLHNHLTSTKEYMRASMIIELTIYHRIMHRQSYSCSKLARAS